jgi:hypothetical protein
MIHHFMLFLFQQYTLIFGDSFGRSLFLQLIGCLFGDTFGHPLATLGHYLHI